MTLGRYDRCVAKTRAHRLDLQALTAPRLQVSVLPDPNYVPSLQQSTRACFPHPRPSRHASL